MHIALIATKHLRLRKTSTVFQKYTADKNSPEYPKTATGEKNSSTLNQE